MRQTEARGTYSLSSGFQKILSDYLNARARDPLDASHPLWGVAKQVQAALADLDAISRRPDLQVKWSFGQGAWAKIPWFAILDKRETHATSRGVYVIYLFREDMSGIYLTLNQGVTKEKEKRGAEEGRAFIMKRAQDLGALCSGLVAEGFTLDSPIDLRTKHALGRDYQLATICHLLYDAHSMPSNPKMVRHLEQVVQVYDDYLAAKHRQSPAGSLSRTRRV